jgi:hypothetical protein
MCVGAAAAEAVLVTSGDDDEGDKVVSFVCGALPLAMEEEAPAFEVD